MNKFLFCTINIFDYDQSIYFRDGDEKAHLIAKVPFTELGKTIPALCSEHDVNNVLLSCRVPGMADQAKASILNSNAISQYGLKNLQVEVID